MPNLVLKEQFQQNKRLFVLVVILVLALLLFLYVLNLSAGKTVAEAPPNLLQQGTDLSDLKDGVDVLPQQVRSADGDAETVKERWETADPFVGPVKLVGVVVGGGGDNVAIIENGGVTYVVEEGSEFDGNWLVKAVGADSVTLVSGGQELLVKIK